MATGTSNTATPNQSTQATPGAILPKTTQIKAMAEQFFAKSAWNTNPLATIGLIPNGSIQFKIDNLGLVEKVILNIVGSVAFKNTSGSTQAISLSPIFPFDVIQNINVVYQGTTNLVNASPYELFSLMAKRHKGVYRQNGAGSVFSQVNNRVSSKVASITAGANTTLNAGNGITGYSSITIAGSSTGIVNFAMNIEIPFTMRKDLPIGLLALQNNSVLCQATITCPALLGTTPANPFYVASAIPGTLSLDPAVPPAITGYPVASYWGVPNDVNLYKFFVANSYLNISVPGQTFRNTGVQALQAILPNNYILTSLLFTLRDSGNALIDTYNKINNFVLNYNNTTTVGKMPMAIREYLQEIYYQGSPVGLGQLVWDATTHEMEANGMIDTSFLDLYNANNPVFYADIDASVSAPGTFSVMREMIVPAQTR